jgi:hypothetical protein
MREIALSLRRRQMKFCYFLAPSLDVVSATTVIVAFMPW